MNPYRAAERALAALVVVIILGMLAAIAWVITVTESWPAVGWIALVLFALLIVFAAHDEWENFGNWWCRKREAWDTKHSTVSVTQESK